MIYRHNPQQIADYFASPKVNSSSIKEIITNGIESFIAKRDELVFGKETKTYYEEKEHQIIGSAVDCYLTQGEEEYFRQYAVSKMLRKPPEKPMSIVRALFDRKVLAREAYHIEEASGFLGTTPNPSIPAECRTLDFFAKDLYEIADQHQFYMNRRIPVMDKLVPIKDDRGKPKKDENGKPLMGKDTRSWKEDNRIANMLADGLCHEYWAELKGSIGKQILADNESMVISSMIMSLKTHPFTSFIFKEEEGVDIIYQMPLYFTLYDIECKILPDMFIVNHNDKTITPLDGKTTSRYITRFNKEVRKWRYDVQASFYTTGIELCRDQIGKLIGKDITEYSMNLFAFIVESAIKPGVPLIYALDEQVLIEGQWGDYEKNLLGFEQGLKSYKEWLKFDFSIHNKYWEDQGVIVLHKNYEKENI